MSRVAICQNHSGKQHVLVDGVAESVALSENALRVALKALWPDLRDTELESVIEYAERLAAASGGVS